MQNQSLPPFYLNIRGYLSPVLNKVNLCPVLLHDNHKLISPFLLERISSIFFIYAGAFSIFSLLAINNAIFIQSIGSGIGIYSGLFQSTDNDIFSIINILSLIPLAPFIELKQGRGRGGNKLINQNRQEFHNKSGLKDLQLKIYDVKNFGSNILQSIITKFF